MKIKSIFNTAVLFFILFSCKKTEDMLVPVQTPSVSLDFSGCRIIQESSNYIPVWSGAGANTDSTTSKYNYNSEGFITRFTDSYHNTISNINREYSSFNMAYKDGLMVSAADNSQTYQEIYEYKNGVLSRILVTKDAGTVFLNYEINIEADANKRIIKMTNNKGLSTEIKRDVNGNITEIINYASSDKRELVRIELSDYDGKKSLAGLYKGWQFNIHQDIGDYILSPYFSMGSGGNPRKKKVYNLGLLNSEYDISYEYGASSYPIKINSTDKMTKKVITNTYKLADCK